MSKYVQKGKMWVFYLISLPLTIGMVLITLKYFAGPDVPRYVLLTVGYTWFCSLSIIILVPADIWTVITLTIFICNRYISVYCKLSIYTLSELFSLPSLNLISWMWMFRSFRFGSPLVPLRFIFNLRSQHRSSFTLTLTFPLSTSRRYLRSNPSCTFANYSVFFVCFLVYFWQFFFFLFQVYLCSM